MAEVAICMATYNGEKYIEEQLVSLQNQTFSDFHCYIQDDGSDDKTIEIISDFINRSKSNGDDRFELVRGGYTSRML